MTRLDDLVRFYELLDRLQRRGGGTRTLSDLSSFTDWPKGGVYFFFETGEERRESGSGSRCVRVGTHALRAGSKSTLRGRLAQHRGRSDLGGNHRGSIFRLLVGQALQARGDFDLRPSWGVKGDLSKAASHFAMGKQEVTIAEADVERAVSSYLRDMRVLCLAVEDAPSRDSRRGYVERNAIALLSNFEREAIDPPSSAWLGSYSSRALVRLSGMWNQQHVEHAHEPAFLDVLEEFTRRYGVGA